MDRRVKEWSGSEQHREGKVRSQKGSKMRPQSGEHWSALPGYHSAGQTPVPAAQPAMQFGSVLMAFLRTASNRNQDQRRASTGCRAGEGRGGEMGEQGLREA